MKRFPKLQPQAIPAEAVAIVGKVLSVSSDGLGGPFNLLLRSPAMAERFIGLLTYFNEDTTVLDPLCRRLAVLVLAQYARARYAWWGHSRRALANGEFSRETIEALKEGRQPKALTVKQSAVVAYVRQLVLPSRTSDVTFTAVRRWMADDELAELIALCGIYSGVALILRESDAELPPGEIDPISLLP